MNECKVKSVNGPVVTVEGDIALSMQDMVLVGYQRLIGEVVGLQDKQATVQVYESTTGLAPGHPVVPTGAPMQIELGPGLLRGIFDGIARPLKAIEEESGAFIPAGAEVPTLSHHQMWQVAMKIKAGEKVTPGQIFAECQETESILHHSMVPPKVKGEVIYAAADGEYTVEDVLARIKTDAGEVELKLAQFWPIRQPRPVALRRPVDELLTTGQRIIDTMFPIGKGGCACVPGPFGAGKTIIQHQLAKWSDADIIIYLGCGERGNEMTQVLEEFGSLQDPRTGKPLLDRTVLIANTSNMPVAAREASIYTGMTIAEYYRDMGYHVALMADSTSRWAEALREISGRLEEMPAEEGFPAYLPSRLAEFYERAGYMENLNGTEGSVTAIGAVSPQGGDFSEPVTQTTKRFIRCFWALDRELAYARHFPSVNWNTSYSEYLDDLSGWFEKRFGNDFQNCRGRISRLLLEESKLMEIVKLIGADVLPEDQKLVIECAKVVRVGFLQQDAYQRIDTYVPVEKQYRMMDLILYLYDQAKKVTQRNIPISQLMKTGVFELVTRMKYHIENDDASKFDEYKKQIDDAVAETISRNSREGETA
ncbi:V-type ATP synthase subunit A [Acidaminobacterium chupaoyuni]